MSISTGPIASKGESSASRLTSLMLAPASRRSFRQLLLAIVLPVLVIVLWQWAGNGGSLFGGVLPTPDKVWHAWKVWAFGSTGLSLNPYSGTWLANLLFSAERVGKGFVAAIVVAVPVGLAIGWNRIASGALDPTVQLLRPIPITAWLPFSIAVFGIRDMGAVFLIALGAFYPIVVNTAQGARDIERNLVRAAMMMGAGRWTILRRVVLPASLPSIFTGLADRARHRLDRRHRRRNGRGQIRSRLCAVGRLLCRPNGCRDCRHGDHRPARPDQRSRHSVDRTDGCWRGGGCNRSSRDDVMTMGTIAFENVSKTFSGQTEVRALDGINLAVGEGEFVALLGPSGCGKSTLLNLLAGFEKNDRGHLAVRRQDGNAAGSGPRRGVSGGGAVSMAQRLAKRDFRARRSRAWRAPNMNRRRATC